MRKEERKGKTLFRLWTLEKHPITLPCGPAHSSWWRHQLEAFSALLAICAGNSPVTGEFPAQRPVAQSFEVFFDQRPNKRLSEAGDLRRHRAHCDAIVMYAEKTPRDIEGASYIVRSQRYYLTTRPSALPSREHNGLSNNGCSRVSSA